MDEPNLSLLQSVREKLNVINNSKSTEKLAEALTALLCFLPHGSKGRHVCLAIPGVQEKFIKDLFMKNHYYQVCIIKEKQAKQKSKNVIERIHEIC